MLHKHKRMQITPLLASPADDEDVLTGGHSYTPNSFPAVDCSLCMFNETAVLPYCPWSRFSVHVRSHSLEQRSPGQGRRSVAQTRRSPVLSRGMLHFNKEILSRYHICKKNFCPHLSLCAKPVSWDMLWSQEALNYSSTAHTKRWKALGNSRNN